VNYRLIQKRWWGIFALIAIQKRKILLLEAFLSNNKPYFLSKDGKHHTIVTVHPNYS